MSDRQEQEKRRDRALAVLETYGADMARWPDADRRDLAALIEQDPALSERMCEERALDTLLASAPVEPASYALQSRIFGQLQGRKVGDEALHPVNFWRQLMSVLWPYGSATVPAGALAISLVLGSAVGAVTTTAANEWSEEQSYEVVALALGDTVLTEEWQ